MILAIEVQVVCDSNPLQALFRWCWRGEGLQRSTTPRDATAHHASLHHNSRRSTTPCVAPPHLASLHHTCVAPPHLASLHHTLRRSTIPRVVPPHLRRSTTPRVAVPHLASLHHTSRRSNQICVAPPHLASLQPTSRRPKQLEDISTNIEEGCTIVKSEYSVDFESKIVSTLDVGVCVRRRGIEIFFNVIENVFGTSVLKT